jgi:hypothetical protein
LWCRARLTAGKFSILLFLLVGSIGDQVGL